MSTERLWLQDPYLAMCRATVLAVEDDDVVLDRTPCFPRSGDQVGDTGRLGGTGILDTYASAHEVVHRLGPDGARPQAGDTVVVELDWARRYVVMRAHSLLHLATIAVEEHAGVAAVAGTQVSPDRARLDLAPGCDIDLAHVTLAARAAIAADTPIELSLLADDPNRRIWRTGELPGIPCSGTHVRRTGEIGQFAMCRGERCVYAVVA